MESDNINSFRFLKQNILTIRNISKSKNNYNKVSKIESNKEKCMSFRKIISNNSRSVSRHKDSILSEIEKVPKYCKKDIEKETKENLNLYNKTCHSNGDNKNEEITNNFEFSILLLNTKINIDMIKKEKNEERKCFLLQILNLKDISFKLKNTPDYISSKSFKAFLYEYFIEFTDEKINYIVENQYLHILLVLNFSYYLIPNLNYFKWISTIQNIKLDSSLIKQISESLEYKSNNVNNYIELISSIYKETLISLKFSNNIDMQLDVLIIVSFLNKLTLSKILQNFDDYIYIIFSFNSLSEREVNYDNIKAIDKFVFISICEHIFKLKINSAINIDVNESNEEFKQNEFFALHDLAKSLDINSIIKYYLKIKGYSNISDCLDREKKEGIESFKKQLDLLDQNIYCINSNEINNKIVDIISIDWMAEDINYNDSFYKESNCFYIDEKKYISVLIFTKETDVLTISLKNYKNENNMIKNDENYKIDSVNSLIHMCELKNFNIKSTVNFSLFLSNNFNNFLLLKVKDFSIKMKSKLEDNKSILNIKLLFNFSYVHAFIFEHLILNFKKFHFMKSLLNISKTELLVLLKSRHLNENTSTISILENFIFSWCEQRLIETDKLDVDKYNKVDHNFKDLMKIERNKKVSKISEVLRSLYFENMNIDSIKRVLSFISINCINDDKLEYMIKSNLSNKIIDELKLNNNTNMLNEVVEYAICKYF